MKGKFEQNSQKLHENYKINIFGVKNTGHGGTQGKPSLTPSVSVDDFEQVNSW